MDPVVSNIFFPVSVSNNWKEEMYPIGLDQLSRSMNKFKDFILLSF